MGETEGERRKGDGMIDEKSYIQTDEQYSRGIALDSHDGRYMIVNAREGGKGTDYEGKIYSEWCYPQKKKDGKNVPGNKGVPWGVRIGDKTEAVGILKRLIESITGDGVFEDDKGDVPF